MKRFNTRLFGRLLPVVGAVTLAATVLAMGTSAAAPPAPYVNGFDSASDVDFGAYPNEAMSDVSLGSGTIPSADGGYAVAGINSGSFTRLGGYSNSFPAEGYTTSVDIYLDPAVSTAGADLRFDWASAISNTSTRQPIAVTTSSASARTAQAASS